MSDYLKDPLYKNRALENQFLNCIWNCHDLCCGCNNTKSHLLHLLTKEECRHFTDDTTTKDLTPSVPTATDIDDVDLETVFAATDEELG